MLSRPSTSGARPVAASSHGICSCSPLGHVAAPAALAELEGHVRHGAGEALVGDRLAADRGADVVGVDPEVGPQRLDAVAQRALVAARRRRGPGRVVEQREHARPAASATSAHSSASSPADRPARSSTSAWVTSGEPEAVGAARRPRWPSNRWQWRATSPTVQPSHRLGLLPLRLVERAEQLLEVAHRGRRARPSRRRAEAPCSSPSGSVPAHLRAGCMHVSHGDR